MNYIQEAITRRLSSEELNSEFGRMLLSTAQYTDLQLSLETRGMIERNTDLTRMQPDDMRRFLAYFYVQVRNYVRPKGVIKVTLTSIAPGIPVSSGETVLSRTGTLYRTSSSAMLTTGVPVTIAVEQAEYYSQSGIYDRFIQIDVEKIDLSSIRLFSNNSEIALATTPYDGYIPFYFGSRLYIKIFNGPSTGEIELSAYTVTYATTDGLDGNIGADQFTGFGSIIRNPDTLEPVKYTIENEAIGNGAFPPSTTELRSIQRYWMSTRNTVSKLSDYRYWYRMQPEIGDAVVWSDMEEIEMDPGFTTLTGLIRVALLSKTGVPIIPEDSRIPGIEERLNKVRDVGVTVYREALPSQFYFDVIFNSTGNDNQFVSFANKVISEYFTINGVGTKGESLFDALDVSTILFTLQKHISVPTGLEVITYFYTSLEVLPASPATLITAYQSVGFSRLGDAKYRFLEFDMTGAVTSLTEYTELMTSATLADVITDTAVVIGTHDYATGVITVTKALLPSSMGTFEAYSESKSRSLIQVGGFLKYRKLKGVNFIKTGGVRSIYQE